MGIKWFKSIKTKIQFYKGEGMNRLYILSIVVGIFAAAACIPFRYLISLVASTRPYLYGDEASLFNIHSPLLAHVIMFITIFVLFLLVAYLVKWYPKISGSGLPQTQALMYGRVVYNKPFTYLIVKFIGGVLSLGSGLSLGREGTSVQMGSLSGWITGNIFKVKSSRKRHLIAAGAGAGVAAAFTAPLSSSILILETLQKFSMPQTAICTLLAGGVAGIFAKIFVPNNIYSVITFTLPNTPELSLVGVFIAMGLFFAFVGKGFSNALTWGRIKYKLLDTCKWKQYTSTIYFKVFFLTVVTFTVGSFFPTMIGGDQTFLTQQANVSVLHDQVKNIFLSILYITVISSFTILSNSSGYPGGIFLPMMTIGGLTGKLFYQLLLVTNTVLVDTYGKGLGIEDSGLSGYFILIGMSAFFIAVVRTPLTGFILISEMTGHYEVFFPAVIVGIAAFYFGQLLKTPAMNDILYDFALQKMQKDEPPYSYVCTEVLPKSYLVGQTPQTLQLPKNCELTSVSRTVNGIAQTFTFTGNFILQPYDECFIKVDSKNLEKVYEPLVSMSL